MIAAQGGGVLVPHGPAAARIGELWWVMLAIATLVFLLVMALLAVALLRRREAGERVTPEGDRRGTALILIGGAVAPAIILAGVFIFTLRVLGALASAEPDDGLVVDVVGKQWWWELHYPGATPAEGFVTANELHIPVGKRVRLRLSAPDVIHSFWVPELQGKMDLIPGTTRTTWIMADRPGVYRGQCAEFCGVQHANMALLVIAEPPARYAAWVAAQRRPAAEPPDESSRRGREAFLSSGCILCHAVRGTTAGGRLGPDLTHLASRRTIAAAMLANTRGNLAGWIADPQGIKPGSKMPLVPLPPGDLHAVLHYLETLR